ncbi:hypothetical protein AJ80_05906 [Polytolypa hystricis UAMH7299]|uniref:PQ loop repeat protein n=1 Tax=Polytolypa hystricis (strain UAMH7299) TaxID=1447883 RepID=A0A2B7Y0A8_POLH7|nr:hypothetical protein AJ80_05906 [Polytolypa hystricis UAMH7299]
MPSSWVNSPFTASLPDHCEPTSAFLVTISSYLHICIPTPLALLSSTLGAFSIVSWLFAQLPQIYKNYNLQSTSGLSVYFLVEWCLGDSTNLLGSIFTHQAGWQITIASYYVLVDVVLVFQYYWYTYYKPWRLSKVSYSTISGGGGNSDVWDGIVPSGGSYIRQMSPSSSTRSSEPKSIAGRKGPGLDYKSSPSYASPYEKTGTSSRTIIRTVGTSNISPFASPRTVLFISMLCAVLANASSASHVSGDLHALEKSPESATQLAGRISSWLSTVLYLGSRLPQLYKNHRRKSTSGLSPLLFFAAFCGNFFYSSSLLTNPNAWSDLPPYGGGGWAGPEGNNRAEWTGRAIPFFLGAAGVLALDAAMGAQFLMYREQSEDIVMKVRNTRNGRRRSQWRRVSGWLPGWIPSISPERKAASEESQGLLQHEQTRYDTV